MTVLVKRLLTDEFLTETDSWTMDPALARDFMNPAAAEMFCRIHALEDTAPVLRSQGMEVEIYPLSHATSYADAPLNDY